MPTRDGRRFLQRRAEKHFIHKEYGECGGQGGLPPEIFLLLVVASMLMVSSVLLILSSLRGY